MIINLSKPNKYLVGAQLDHSVHDESTMTITCLRGHAELQYEQEVEFTYRGVTVLKGQVDSISRTLTGMTEETTYTIIDGWRKLRAPYISETGIISTICGMSSSGGGNGGKVNVYAALKGVLDMAVKNGLLYDYVLNISNTAKMVPFVENASSYADLIRQILNWRPNSSSWFDYSSGNAVLHIADHARLETANINVNEMLTTDLSLTPRYDLRPNAVMFVLEQTNNFGGRVYVRNIAPSGANPNQPNVLCCQVDGESVGRTTDPEVQEAEAQDENNENIRPPQGWAVDNKANIQTVIGREIIAGDTSYKCAEFWAEKIPALSKVKSYMKFSPLIKTGLASKDVPSPKNYDTSAVGYEVIDGQFSDTTKLKWCITEIKQNIYIPAGGNKDLHGYFPYISKKDGTYYMMGIFKISVRTMNKSRHSYLTNRDQTDVPDSVYDDLDNEEDEEEVIDNVNNAVPDSLFATYYQDIVNDLYAETRTLQYDGSLTLRNVPVKSYIGKKINIIGLADYMTSINSNAVSMTVDYLTRTANLSLGAPVHLSVQDMLTRSKALQEMQRATIISQVNNDTDEEDKPTQTRTRPRWSFDYDNQARNPKNRGKNPTYGPWSSSASHATVKQPPTGSFALGCEVDADGTVLKVLMNKGLVKYDSGRTTEVPFGFDNAIDGYINTGLTGRIYLNIIVHRTNGILVAKLENSAEKEEILTWPIDPTSPSDPSLKATGTYSFEIGEVTSDGDIKQVQIGDIFLSFPPASTNYPM